MRFLRSSVLATLVSLLFLAGYGHRVFDPCCEAEEMVQAGDQDEHGGADAPVKTDGCHCFCHAIFVPHTAEPVRVRAAALMAIEPLVLVDELPPETVPLGIDYPPQLA